MCWKKDEMKRIPESDFWFFTKMQPLMQQNGEYFLREGGTIYLMKYPLILMKGLEAIPNEEFERITEFEERGIHETTRFRRIGEVSATRGRFGAKTNQIGIVYVKNKEYTLMPTPLMPTCLAKTNRCIMAPHEGDILDEIRQYHEKEWLPKNGVKYCG